MFFFYFESQNRVQSNENCIDFVEEFRRITKGELAVLLESGYDYDFFRRYFSNDDSVKLIPIRQEINRIRLNAEDKQGILRKYNHINFRRFYFVLNRKTVNNNNYEDFVCRCIIFFERLLSEYNVKCVHFGINQAFRSLEICILHELLRERNVSFFMIFKKPFRGRHFVYDNIHLRPCSIVSDYRNLLERRVPPEIVGKMETYFNVYKEFKERIDVPRILDKARSGRKKLLSFRGLPGRLADAGFSMICRKIYGAYVNRYDTSRPYVLLLLNKANNYLANCALAYFTDISYIAKSIWMSLPLGYSMIVKDNPLMPFPNRSRLSLYELVRKIPDFYYLCGEHDTRSLVKKADIIIHNCSTSGVEALMEFKHVIVFGKHPVFFDFPDPPVHSVSCVEDLPGIIRECLSTPPPRDKIYAYFHSLLGKSENYHREEDINYINFTQDREYFKNMANFLYKKIKENGII